MKFRIRWCRHYREWVLESEPVTSSAWDTISRSRFRWVLRLEARIYTQGSAARAKRDAGHAVVEEFTL